MRKLPDGQVPSPEVVAAEIAAANAAIDEFAVVMKEAMARKAKEGRTGWDDPTLRSAIVNDLIAHAIVTDYRPGEEIHVANFAMMLFYQNRRIAAGG